MKIKKHTDYYECPTCKGEGVVRSASHDCWGRTEWHSHICQACHEGIVIRDEILEKMREKLK